MKAASAVPRCTVSKLLRWRVSCGHTLAAWLLSTREIVESTMPRRPRSSRKTSRPRKRQGVSPIEVIENQPLGQYPTVALWCKQCGCPPARRVGVAVTKRCNVCSHESLMRLDIGVIKGGTDGRVSRNTSNVVHR